MPVDRRYAPALTARDTSWPTTASAYLLMLWAASAFTFAYEAIAVPYAAELGADARTAGILLAAGPLGQTIGIAALGRTSPRARMRLLLPLAILSTAALIPTLVVHTPAAVIAFIALAGLGSAFQAPLNTLFGRAVPTQYRGRAFGIASTGLSLSYATTMLTAGAIASNPHVPAATVIGASGLLGTLVLLALTQLWPRDAFHRGTA